MADGGTGFNYATDSITVEPLTIDTAEMVLIKGLDTLSRDSIKIPSFEKFAVAMAAAAQTISCTAHKQTIRALKAVGLGLNIPGGKTTLLTEDESLCFIDLRMRDCYNDQGFEPNTECDDWLGWNDIWNSPDIWVCPQNDSCYLAASAPPEPAYSNRIGFTIYNAHPNLISDPAQLHLYYTMASSGELWDFNWIDWYFTAGDYTCYLGDEIATSPVTIPAINPSSFFTGWTTWTPPNFVNPNLPFYAHPDSCWILPEIDPLDGEPKYEICLLARLLSEADPIRNETFDNITHNVIYNNNIVTKNLFFLNPGMGVGMGVPPTVAGNPSVMFICNNNAAAANLNIVYQQIANGLGVQGSNDSLEISLILSPQLWNNWVQTGQQGEGITLLTQREVRIDNYATAKLLNIPFAAYERQPIAIKTTILTSGGKTTTNQLSINNPVFSFYLTHESSNQQTINPSSKCQFVLNNKQMQQHDNTNEIKLIAYPNPVTNQSGYLQFMLPQAENISVAIYNLSGKKVQQIVSNQPYEAGLHQLPVSTAQLTDGIYICHLTTTNKTVATKFVTLTR
ncbi:MAG: T9SS type A sorting domain-containing protein [Sphingobacteriales bacterium]|nr:T9SS type A sorting domain-containing protein [Sphingobacteriales bacterium]